MSPLTSAGDPGRGGFGWLVPAQAAAFDEAGIRSVLLALERPCFAVRSGGRVGLSSQAVRDTSSTTEAGHLEALAWAPALPPGRLGDPEFGKAHGTPYAYYTGAMANGIASEDLVIALGREGFLGSFGAAGLLPGRVREAIQRIQAALPGGPYLFNLIHSPSEPALERECVRLYLDHGIRGVEAAAFLGLTPYIVHYRVSGLGVDPAGEVEIRNRVVAKVSRKEVATQFMEPAPAKLLGPLLAQGLITEEQARLAERVPVADDVTVEADSAGHTDNRPMLALLPSILALRDEIQSRRGYARPVRVGAGGGIGTPAAALGTYVMGAAYVVTGSVNQGCVEAGICEHARELLAMAEMTDVTMAPAADMFEMGVRLQVLKRGTLFPMRAQKLYDVYRQFGSLEEIPAREREKLEKQIFRESLDSIWEQTSAFFAERDPGQLEKAAAHPKRKMALAFRWYLGLSSRWATTGETGREMDYQIWCGPAMGAFNAWARGSHLEEAGNRKVADVARQLLTGAAYGWRVQALRNQGVALPASCSDYRPRAMPPTPARC